MIAAVKGCHAAFPALLALFLLPAAASGADDASDAARELARKTVVFAGRGEPVTFTWRNVSSLGSNGFAQARAAFDSALREANGRTAEIAAAVEARITVSENQSQYLLVEEIRRGDEKQVWMAAWKRGETPTTGGPQAMLTRTLLWEQSEPILDVAGAPGQWVVLSPSGARWLASGLAAAIPADKPWPRDPRGRLRPAGDGFEAQLPGMTCRLQHPGAAECKANEEGWTLDSGSRSLLVATFAPGRNYFDGRVATQSGQRKTVPPFYSAAALEQAGGTWWVLALTDGRAQIFDASWEPAGVIPNWGSDIAGTDARCGGHSVVLATRAGEAREGDAIRGYTVVNGVAAPAGPPIEFGGPVTALWPSGSNAAVAVVRDPESGKYSAYLVQVACGS